MANIDVRGEVRKAVRDYVEQLITERHAPGRGMAVSAHDLMVAAKSAGHRANRNEANQLLDAFADTGMRVIKETPRKPIQPRYNPHKSKPKTDNPHLSKKDYHWMAWPSPSSTPEPPSTPAVQSARPMSRRELAAKMIPRPESAAAATVPRPAHSAHSRPKSARPPSARAPTPRIPTPAPAIPIRAPTPSLPPTPVSEPRDEGIEAVYADPQPTVAHLNHGFNERPVSVLSYTSAYSQQAGRVATPREFDPDYRDPMEPQVVHEAALKQNWADQNYVPGLQAWVTNANDYEREVAFNLMQAIKTGGGKHSPYKGANKTHVRHPTAGVKTSYNVWDQYKNPYWNDHDMMIAGKSIGQKPASDYYRYSKNGPKPGVARHTTRVIQPKEYTCEASFFMTSNRPFKRDFVINPEWASESNKMKRNLSMMMTTKGPQGFRYDSK